MTKIIFILIGSFCLAAMSAQAQQPTQKDTTKASQNQNYRLDMVKIQSGEVPTSLRTTLSDTRYKGWENGTIYRSKKNDVYVVEMKDANNKNEMTTYRFDAQGKLIPEE
jgi:hypothetical protein